MRCARSAAYGDGWYPLVKTLSDITDHLPRYRALPRADRRRRQAAGVHQYFRLPLDDMAQSWGLVAGLLRRRRRSHGLRCRL